MVEVHFDRAHKTLSLRNLSESEVAELLEIIGKWIREKRPSQALNFPKNAGALDAIEIKRRPRSEDPWLLRVPQDPRAVTLLDLLMKEARKGD